MKDQPLWWLLYNIVIYHSYELTISLYSWKWWRLRRRRRFGRPSEQPPAPLAAEPAWHATCHCDLRNLDHHQVATARTRRATLSMTTIQGGFTMSRASGGDVAVGTVIVVDWWLLMPHGTGDMTGVKIKGCDAIRSTETSAMLGLTGSSASTTIQYTVICEDFIKHFLFCAKWGKFVTQ
jgi:hypothetical protein